MQVSEAIFKYGRELNVKCDPDLRRPTDLSDSYRHSTAGCTSSWRRPAVRWITSGAARWTSVAIKTVILDEADEMLDMGFADDIDSILQATPEERQTVLFSATMPARINALARKYQRDPVRIQIGRSDNTPGTTASFAQSAYMVQRSHKACCTRPHPRHRRPQGHARLLPYPTRGRPVDRDDERSRVPARGVARWHGSTTARPGHGTPA